MGLPPATAPILRNMAVLANIFVALWYIWMGYGPRE
jgi:hypothetical protein